MVTPCRGYSGPTWLLGGPSYTAWLSSSTVTMAMRFSHISSFSRNLSPVVTKNTAYPYAKDKLLDGRKQKERVCTAVPARRGTVVLL